MRSYGLYSLIASLLLFLSFVTAQESSSTATAPAQDSSSTAAPTASPPTVTAPAPSGSATGSAPPVDSQSSTQSSNTPTTTQPSGGGGGGSGTSSSVAPWGSTPPDVLLRVPNLSIGRIELDVDNLQAEVNLAAEIANLVSINAGVQVGVRKVNITIADVQAKLDLIIRLGHLVDIVNRTLASLDLNPLLINLLNEVTDIVDNVVGAVDGLLGSILQGNTRLNFIIDNLGNIVQEVVGEAGSILSTIVGNYQTNMTFTGVQKDLGNGLTQKTYSYSPLGSLVNIIFNTLGQVVQAVAVKGSTSTASGGTSSTVPPSSSTAAPVATTTAA